MSSNILRLHITTDTSILFIASLPTDITVHKALPIILKKYKAVVSQYFSNRPTLLNVNTVTRFTKNGCFFAKDQFVGHVLNDNDEVQVTFAYKHKEAAEQQSNNAKEKQPQPIVKVQEQLSKKQKLDNKKAEKAKQEKREENKKKDEVRVKIYLENEKQAKQTKKEINASGLASDFLSKYRSVKEPEAPVVKKKTVKILEEEDSDF